MAPIPAFMGSQRIRRAALFKNGRKRFNMTGIALRNRHRSLIPSSFWGSAAAVLPARAWAHAQLGQRSLDAATRTT